MVRGCYYLDDPFLEGFIVGVRLIEVQVGRQRAMLE